MWEKGGRDRCIQYAKFHIKRGKWETVYIFVLFLFLFFARIWKILKEGGSGGEGDRNKSKTSPEVIFYQALPLGYVIIVKYFK